MMIVTNSDIDFYVYLNDNSLNKDIENSNIYFYFNTQNTIQYNWLMDIINNFSSFVFLHV